VQAGGGAEAQGERISSRLPTEHGALCGAQSQDLRSQPEPKSRAELLTD